MKHDCLKASKICIWRRTDLEGYTDGKKRWAISPMVPSWYCVCGYPWYELKNGDEIDINKSCKIDLSGRVIVRNNNEFLLVNYGGEDVSVMINRKDCIVVTDDGDYKMVYHSGALSCSVAGGINFEFKNKSGESETLYLPPGWSLEKI